MKVKAVCLLSGGLDSILACRVIQDQGVQVFGLNFVSPFCTCTKKGCRHEARRAAEQLGIPLKVVAKGEEYIKMIKKPKHGYGSAMNPCIDCRIFIFTRAKDYMEEIGAQFVFTDGSTTNCARSITSSVRRSSETTLSGLWAKTTPSEIKIRRANLFISTFTLLKSKLCARITIY